MRTIAENLPFDLWVIGTDNKYLMQNKRSISYWGNCIGKTIFETNVNIEVQKLWNEANQRVLQGEVVEFESQLDIKGKKLWHHSLISPVYDNEEIKGIIGVNIDISESKTNEELLIRRKNELEKFEKLVIGRELRMIELKKRIHELEILLNSEDNLS